MFFYISIKRSEMFFIQRWDLSSPRSSNAIRLFYVSAIFLSFILINSYAIPAENERKIDLWLSSEIGGGTGQAIQL